MKHFIKVLLIGITLMLTGCSLETIEKIKQSISNYDILVCIGTSDPSYLVDTHAILVDKETRVMYIENIGTNGGVPVVMPNPDGTPRIYEGDLSISDNEILVCIGTSDPSYLVDTHAILVDKETRVMYIENIGTNGGVPVVMPNPDGTPRIYEGDLK